MQDGALVIEPFQFCLAFVFCRYTNCGTEVRIVSSAEDVYCDKCACLQPPCYTDLQKLCGTVG